MNRILNLLVLSATAAGLHAQTDSQWVTLPTSAPQPTARINHAMASDGSLCWMFGGQDATGLLNDLWIFDGVGWTDLTASVGAAPPARQGHGMIWDSARNRLVVHGGETGIGGPEVGDTWAFELSSFTWVPLGGSLPRAFHGMSYDATRDRVVAFGGSLGFVTLGQTSEFDGTAWAVLPVMEPPARFGTATPNSSEPNRVRVASLACR